MTIAADSAADIAEHGPYRVMLVDDSAVIRGIFRRTLEADPDVEIVASVANGKIAVDTLQRNSLDVVVLDIEMPVMDGMTALREMLKIDPDLQVVMASTLTQANAEISLKALAAGAADYIPKPVAKHEIHGAEAFRRELLDKVKALGRARRTRSPGNRPALRPAAALQPAAETQTATPSIVVPKGRFTLRAPSAHKPKVICIGSSTGGPPALIKVLPGLKKDFDLPILITQHMPKTFTGIMAQHIAKAADRPCAEATDGEPIESGRIYVAPGESHMVVEQSAGGPVIRLNDDPPENFCKPAVDPLLRSAAEVYGKDLLTVILTGMGHDGLAGGQAVTSAGGSIVAQDEATSVVWGMPGAVATAGLCCAVLPLEEIAAHVRTLAGKPV